MSYRIKKFEQKFENGEVLVEYGVDYDSLDKQEKSLYCIRWHGWNNDTIQKLIDRIKGLQGKDYFDYVVEYSELRISIDNEYVLFFDWRTDNFNEDFRWTTNQFIQFLEDFKTFVNENTTR